MSRFIRGEGRFVRGKYTAEEGITEPATTLWKKRLCNTASRLHINSWTISSVSGTQELLRVSFGCWVFSFFKELMGPKAYNFFYH